MANKHINELIPSDMIEMWDGKNCTVSSPKNLNEEARVKVTLSNKDGTQQVCWLDIQPAMSFITNRPGEDEN